MVNKHALLSSRSKTSSVLKPFRHFLVIIYTFYVVYTPAPSASSIFNKYIVLTFLAVLLILPYLFERNSIVKRFLELKQIQLLFSVCFLFSIYLLAVMIFNDVPIRSLDETRLLQNNVIPLMSIHAIIIFDKLHKLGYSTKGMFELLLKFSAFQGIFVIAGLFVPQVKAISVYLYNVSGSENIWTEATRIYGFTGEFTFVTPIYHGLLAGVAVYLTATRKVNYWAYLPFIFIAVLFNGRTGFVIFAIVFLLSIGWVFLKQGRVFTFISSIMIFSGFIYLLIFVMEKVNPLTAKFFVTFLADTQNLLFEGESSGNFAVLNKEVSTFPEGISLLFGTGEHVFKSDLGFRADSGFTNDIFFGGLFYVLVYYSIFLLFLVHNSKADKVIFIALFVGLLFASYKGQIMRGSSVLFFLVFVKLLNLSNFDGFEKRPFFLNGYEKINLETAGQKKTG